MCKEEVKEEKRRSVGGEDSLTSADRIRRFTVKQFGYNVLSLARRGLKVRQRLSSAAAANASIVSTENKMAAALMNEFTMVQLFELAAVANLIYNL